jgi:primosomal protein N' (replication factor Y) (superfamily II helicase)
MNLLYAVIILSVPVDRMFTYCIPDEMQQYAVPGKRVIVQFGSRKFYTGILFELVQTVPEGITPKSIEMVLDDEPIISQHHLRFWNWMSEYYLCSIGDIMKAALPSGLRIESETKIQINPEFSFETHAELQHHEQIIAEALQHSECLSVTEIQRILGIKHVQHLIRNLISQGVAISYEEFAEKFIPKTEIYLSIAPDYEDEDKLLQLSNTLSKKAPKQSDVLINYLHETTVKQHLSELSKRVLLQRGSQQAVQALIKKGVFIENEKIVSRFAEKKFELNDFSLSPEQEYAFQSLNDAFQKNNIQLLHGVTSSGKTEIYIRMIEKELSAGKQVLYLLPEIALTQQIIRRLQAIFGNKIGIYHHRFNIHEKVELWNSVNSPPQEDPKFQIILGTRSALFLPFSNLGLIIIDEEHDSSFKQTDSAPRYNARDAAIVLSGILNAKVLLGTATPSVETYYNVVHEKYGMTQLNSRFNNMPLPGIEVVDMKKEAKKGSDAWYISSVLKEAMAEALSRKRQIILFQNRRGFVPVLQCTQCGWIPGCRNCDVTLTYHKKVNQMKCHLCGLTDELYSRCPECGNTHIRYVGFGTEKVEEEVKSLFPNAVIARMDTDTTRGKYSHQRIIQAFEDGETDILVGTQMVSKGLDFDRVSLVGILNADNLYHFPDFRSFERGFQMMTQIIGRAGRHEVNGTVILQTRKPQHPVITAVINNDFHAFIQEQLKERHLYRYPPYYRLVQLSVQHKNLQKAVSFSVNLKQKLSSINGLILLGPEEPVYGRIKQYYIRNILIKIPRDQKQSKSRLRIRAVVSDFLLDKHYSGLKIIADADPM